MKIVFGGSGISQKNERDSRIWDPVLESFSKLVVSLILSFQSLYIIKHPKLVWTRDKENKKSSQHNS